MTSRQLFKFNRIATDIARVKVQERIRSGKKTTFYEDEQAALEAYRHEEIKDRIKRWMLSENLAVLSGAGTSVITNKDGHPLGNNPEIRHTGKTVGDIWLECKNAMGQNEARTIQNDLGEPDSSFQLERLISKIEIFVSANSESNKDWLKKTVKRCEAALEKIITTLQNECDLTLEASIAPHPKFLRSTLSARYNKSRIQLFTLNYDTLFEQAAEVLNATVIDGFTFSRNPTFNGSNFDLDIVKRNRNRAQHDENYEEKVFKLYKLHGSLDWRKDGDKVVRVQEIGADGKTVFIPPSISKFEQSYLTPYFEMMSRFQQSLRRENTTLIAIGYGFGDEHINGVIREATRSNLNFELVVVSPGVNKMNTSGFTSELHRLIDGGQGNITLVNDTFQRFTDHIPLTGREESGNNKPEESALIETQGDGNEDPIQ